MKRNATKRALLMSALSLLLCVSMLVGTTFAWFTDSVNSANNIIQAGNLDIKLEYWNGTEWVDVSGRDDILTNTLWEPGVTEIAYLRITNAGSLALKYQLNINIVTETEGVNKAGETFKLSEYLQFGVVENINGETGAYATREAAVAAVTDAKKLNTGYTKAQALYPVGNIPSDVEGAVSELYLALVVYMPTTVDNDANHDGKTVPQIDLGINVFATQMTYEEDSFDELYDQLYWVADKDAFYNEVALGGNVLVTEDMVLDNYLVAFTDTNIYLNEKNITAQNNFLFAAPGGSSNLSIYGEGTITTSTGYAGYATDGGILTVNGGTFELGETNNRAHFYTQNSATTVINGGTFISTDPNTPIVYCINGFVEINGGFFQNTSNPDQALLSMGNNLNYINNQKITLSGGTFVNWNPMDSAFARPWTNPDIPALIVLADGYQMISETQENGDIWYMVVPIGSGN